MERLFGNRRPRRGTSTAIAAVAAATGLVLASAMVWRASSAAFTATTTNGVNTFSAGSVAITDNDSAAVMFNVGGLAPGDTGSGCIRVTYNGSLAADVKLYTSGLSATGSIDNYITIQVEDGAFSSVPTFPACTTFSAAGTIFNNTLNNFGTNDTTFATGVGSWAPTGAAQTKDFRFTYTFSSSAPNTVQGASASITFVWEAQST